MKVTRVKEGLTIEETSEGFVATQPFHITDIPVDLNFPLSGVFDAQGLPRIGDPFGRHNIQALKRTASTTAELVNGAVVTVEYGIPDSSEAVATGAASKERIELKVGTVTEKTIRDINGDLLKVVYQGAAASGIHTQVQTAEVQKPVFRFTVRRDEPKIPFAKGQEFTGRVNRTQFSIFALKTLLLLGISNSETNKGLSQEVAYELVFKADTWQHQAKIVIDGRLPVDAQIGNGLELYDVFESIDFSGLGISLNV